jgi:hypothetical protein
MNSSTRQPVGRSLCREHVFVIIGANHALGRLGHFDRIYPNPLLIYPVYFGLYYVAAWITCRTIERPFLRLRDAAFSWRRTAGAPALAHLCTCSPSRDPILAVGTQTDPRDAADGAKKTDMANKIFTRIPVCGLPCRSG